MEENRGINEKKRGNAWFELSGGKDMREECGKDYYKNVVAASSKDTTSKDAKACAHSCKESIESS